MIPEIVVCAEMFRISQARAKLLCLQIQIQMVRTIGKNIHDFGVP